MATSNGSSILARIIRPAQGDLTPETARSILDWDFPKKDQARIAALSEKANDGKLTPEEVPELEEYILVAEFLALIQSKARISLRKPGHPAA